MSRGSSGSRPAGKTIRRKIFLVMSTFLILFTIVTGYTLCLFMQASRENINQAPAKPEITRLAGKISKNVATLRQQTNQLVQNRDDQLIAQHQATLENMEQILDRLRQTDAPKGDRVADKLRTLTKEHAKAFEELSAITGPPSKPDKSQPDNETLKEKLSLKIQELSASVPRSDAEKLKEVLAQLKRFESAYLETNDPVALDQLDTAANTLKEIIRRISTGDNGLRQEMQDSINTYIIALSRYQAVSFTSDDETLKAAFATEQKRQKQKMRKSSSDLEKHINSLKPSLFELKAAEIRDIARNQKQGNGDVDLDRLTTLLGEYTEALEQSALSPEQKEIVAKIAQEAGASLEELSSVPDDSSGAADSQGKLKDAATRSLKPLAGIAATLRQLATPAPVRSDPVKEIKSFLLRPDILPVAGAAGALLVLGLIAAMGLARSATEPAVRMTDLARRIAEGEEENLRFPDAKKDEFGALASALNVLLSSATGPAAAPQTDEPEQEEKDLNLDEQPLAASPDETTILLDKIGSAAHQIISLSHELPETVELLTEQNRSIHELLEEPPQQSGETDHTDMSDTLTQLNNTNQAIKEMGEGLNVLAMNAAIKAARAGTHGKEFATVGEELEVLAGRSADLATELSMIINKCSEGKEPHADNNEESGPDQLARIAEFNAANSEAVDKIAIDTNIIIDQARDVKQFVSELYVLAGYKTEDNARDGGDGANDSRSYDDTDGLVTDRADSEED